MSGKQPYPVNVEVHAGAELVVDVVSVVDVDVVLVVSCSWAAGALVVTTACAEVVLDVEVVVLEVEVEVAEVALDVDVVVLEVEVELEVVLAVSWTRRALVVEVDLLVLDVEVFIGVTGATEVDVRGAIATLPAAVVLVGATGVIGTLACAIPADKTKRAAIVCIVV